MRDLVAAGVALLLLIVAASLGTTLTVYRKRRRQNRDHERTLGRTIIAEIPADDDLLLFTEDDRHFHYGRQAVDKDRINGVPIAACVSKRHAAGTPIQPTSFEDRPEGIARDRWDVAIEGVDGTTLVECGAIRERISQELARAVFDAVKQDIERRDGAV
jgi:cbb3-type cytochrome oxidase subunit 3